MDRGLHFISGLPRSGSTLLSALLRQNPDFHAGMSSGMGALFQRLMVGMGPRGEMAGSITDEQRRHVLRGVVDNYYYDLHTTKVVFDTNRMWCSKMPAIAELFPQSKVIVCVRELMWIMDSFERVQRKNPLIVSKMARPQDSMSMHTRLGALGSPNGTVGFPWNAVQEAFYGEFADRLVVIDYEALAREPKRAMEFIYKSLDLPPFDHDFENVTYGGGDEFDSQLGIPGLHKVSGKVKYSERPTIMPPELVQRFSGRNFWRRPGGNPRNVSVLLPSDFGSRKFAPRPDGGRGAPPIPPRSIAGRGGV